MLRRSSFDSHKCELASPEPGDQSTGATPLLSPAGDDRLGINIRAPPSYGLTLVDAPSPKHPLGAKRIGEAGCVGAPAAIVNAVLDALSPLGITNLDMPLTPEKIRRAMRAAQGRR